MIVVTVGMRKSGSGWYFQMTNKLLEAGGGRNTHALLKHRPALRSVIHGKNCKIGRLRFRTLARLAGAHFAGETFAVKSHAAPSMSLRAFAAAGLARAVYLYRDPRDVILSALEHGVAARKAGNRVEFARLTSLDDSIAMVKRELVRWEAWMRYEPALKVRYEDLVADTVGELRRLAGFLALDVGEDTLHEIARHYRRGRHARTRDPSIIGDPLHFNKGIPGRFREQMSPEARARCERHLGPYLRKMGYAS